MSVRYLGNIQVEIQMVKSLDISLIVHQHKCDIE